MKKLLIAIGLLMLMVACSQRGLPLQPENVPAPAPMPSQSSPVPASPTQMPVVGNPASPQPITPPPAEHSQQSATPTVSSSVQTHQVRIAGFKFVPAELTVSVGDTVLWTNEDSIGHSVASSDHTIHSDLLGEGKTYTQVMSTPGTFTYACGPHPSMQGKIIVR